MKRGRPLRQDTLRGDRIRELRKSMGMTQEALADRMAELTDLERWYV